MQRICEIETYKTMSMLGLPRARDISGKLGQIDERLSHLVTDMTGDLSKPDETLGQLLAIASELGEAADRKRVPLRGDGGL